MNNSYGTIEEYSLDSVLIYIKFHYAPAESGIKYSSRRSADPYDTVLMKSAIERNFSGVKINLSQYLNATFIEKMFSYIREKDLRDADVYKAAELDRRLYSKITSDTSYKPSKDTCVSLCAALHLTIDETTDMLSRAGYCFSHSSRRDVILEYCFINQLYSIATINDILFKLDEKTLGR